MLWMILIFLSKIELGGFKFQRLDGQNYHY